MPNSSNENDPRLKQDKFERKDKENSSAGMIAGVVIVIIGIIGIFLYYTYEVSPTTPAPISTSQPETVAPSNTGENNPPANETNTAPAATN